MKTLLETTFERKKSTLEQHSNSLVTMSDKLTTFSIVNHLLKMIEHGYCTLEEIEAAVKTIKSQRTE
jgi:hypothetical protein